MGIKIVHVGKLAMYKTLIIVWIEIKLIIK